MVAENKTALLSFFPASQPRHGVNLYYSVKLPNAPSLFRTACDIIWTHSKSWGLLRPISSDEWWATRIVHDPPCATPIDAVLEVLCVVLAFAEQSLQNVSKSLSKHREGSIRKKRIWEYCGKWKFERVSKSFSTNCVIVYPCCLANNESNHTLQYHRKPTKERLNANRSILAFASSAPLRPS